MSSMGLPDLPPGSQPPAPPPLATSDTVDQTAAGMTALWGLYQDNSAVIVADNVVTFGLKATANIPTYPVEQGAFQSYNKVQLPNSGTIRYSAGGSRSDRQAFLASCEAAKQSTDSYDYVSPEHTYPNMQVIGYSYDRSALNGVGLLPVDVMIQEVNPSVAATYATTVAGANGQTSITNAQNPQSNDPQTNGTQQPQPVSAGNQQALSSAAPFYNGITGDLGD